MGILRRVRDGARIVLPATALIGRDPSYDVVLVDGRASGVHAVLRWGKGGWTLRDLASRNGTFIKGKQLVAGEATVLTHKSVVQFGGPREEYQLEDDSAPLPFGRRLDNGRTVCLREGLLTLPDDDRALACIYPGGKDGHTLMIELGDRVSRAIDREVIELDGELWQLRTQMASDQPTVLAARAMTVATIRLEVWASQDLEEITLRVIHGDNRIEQPHHAWHELLMLLARARVHDAGRQRDEQGWIQRDELCRMLNKPVEQLNVAIHRAREQFRRMGVLPSAEVIERRRGPQDIRLGVEDVVLAGFAALPD